MASRKRSKSSTHRLNPATTAKADRMVSRLRANYKLGEQANRDSRSTKDFAAENGLNEHTLRRFKAFATAYSRQQLKELCALRRPNGLPLQFGHVMYLLILDDPAERMKLALRAARLGWTAPELNAAIPEKYRAAKGHGRSLKQPSTAEAGLQQLADEAGRWSRRTELVVAEVERRAVRGVSSRLRDQVEETVAEVDRLGKAARRAKRELQRIVREG